MNNVSNLEQQIEQMQYEKSTPSVPENYYPARNGDYTKTADELVSLIQNGNIIMPCNYQETLFDCSEMAAYLEYKLEWFGYDARIISGLVPGTNDGNHAWVIVQTTDHRVAIEPTRLNAGEYRNAVISGNKDNPVVDAYYNGYDMECYDIYQVIEDSYCFNDWNWWDGILHRK